MKPIHLITAKAPRVDSGHTYYLYLTALNQSYWIIGCALGAGLQSFFEFDSRGFEFALVASIRRVIDRTGQNNERSLVADISAMRGFRRPFPCT